MVQIDDSEQVVLKIKGKALRNLFFNIDADIVVYGIDFVKTVCLKSYQKIVIPVFPIHSQKIAVYHSLFDLRVVQKFL